MIHNLTDRCIAVEVPERSTKNDISNAEGMGQMMFTQYWYAGGEAEDTMITSLPPGQWKILAEDSREIKYHHLTQIIGKGELDKDEEGLWWPDFEHIQLKLSTNDIYDSWQTLMKSKGLDSNTRYVILLKQD